jgi:hypothetical protein
MAFFSLMSSIAVGTRRVLLCGLVFAASAAGDEVVKTYEDPTFNATLSRILVVGVHPDRKVRGQFENSVTRALRMAGADGESSLARLGSTQELTADTLVTAARRADADAVLVTRVVDVQTHNPDATTTFVEYFRAYAAYQDPLPDTTSYTVVVTIDLYVVTSQTRVWGVESTTLEKHNLFGVIDDIANAVTTQLRTDGLIQ